MACDGYISLKILELIFAVVCIIYKRVTDVESNRLFYYLQKQSREWPLLNNITWDENGAIFVDIAYGGFVLISLGLLISQASGELSKAPKTEIFFLLLGALMFIGSGSLELAALDSVEQRLVDNAAILGVLSLVAGLIFIIDLLTASKRRKIQPKKVQQPEKTTQTETKSDMNGNIDKKVPANGVKILPSSPPEEIPVLNSQNQFVGTIPFYTANELKSPKVKIKSTESFLRSEKGEPIIPPGYMLVPRPESVSPPGYASVEPRKLQSPTVTTTGYYLDSREPSPTESDGPEASYRISEKSRMPFVRNAAYRSSFGSYTGRRLAEELRTIREITKSDLDIAKENQALKEILKREKEERMKLEKAELEERKRLEDRLNDLEEYQTKLEKGLKKEERQKLEEKIRELEKDRRMSEKEVQYFGIDDLRESEKQSSPVQVNRDLKEKAKEDDELRKVIEEGFHFLDEEERKKRTGMLYKDLEDTRKRKKESETPSYKSEAQFWLGKDPPSPRPMSPKDPGFVMHTALNWPEPPTSPEDRFRYSAKKANLTRSDTPSPDYPELLQDTPRIRGRGRGMLVRKVDFPEDPVTVEIERPNTVIGNTNSWKKWLQPKQKLQASKSTPA